MLQYGPLTQVICCVIGSGAFVNMYTYSGFYSLENIFSSPYNNFEGNAIDIVMPNNSAFSMLWRYPDGSTRRAGPEFYAAQYLSQALNFEFKLVQAY